MDVRIGIAGFDTAVRSVVDKLKNSGVDIVSISCEYPLEAFDKNCKEVAVYITVSENA